MGKSTSVRNFYRGTLALHMADVLLSDRMEHHGKMRMDLHYVCACKFDLYDVFNSEWNTVYDPRLQR